MTIDDSYFKQPCSVPFKWEIRPGVPKPVKHQTPSSKQRTSSLKPPPSRPTSFHFPSPRTQSSRFPFDKPNLVPPEVVSLGCFSTRKGDSLRKLTNKVDVDPVYKSDIEMLSQWSGMTIKSRPSVYDSPLSSSSFSSYRSSRKMVSVIDAEWAGYGLF